jgi:hypothetical protein
VEQRCNHAASRKRCNLLPGAATLALQLLLLLLLITSATPDAAAARLLQQAPCSNEASPVLEIEGGSVWAADLSGDNNIKPGTTGETWQIICCQQSNGFTVQCMQNCS